MTATVPRQRPPTRGGLPYVRIPKVIYGAPILDPSDGTTHIDYVGKTKRRLAVRQDEHLGLGRNPDDEQPWSDLVDGQFVVLDSDEHLSVPWTDEEHKACEQWWIRNVGARLPHRPRYNWEFNHGCPGQIPKWVAAKQRAERDRGRGAVTRWTDPELFEATRQIRTVPSRPSASRPAPRRPAASRPSLLRRLTRTLPFRAFALWAVLALTVTVATAWGSYAHGDPVPVTWAGAVGAVVASAVCVKWWKTIRRRLRRL